MTKKGGDQGTHALKADKESARHVRILTEGCWEEGKAHDGGQVREHHLAVQLLLKSGGQLYLDPACWVSGVPITMHGRRLVEGRPAQVAEIRVAVVIDRRPSRYEVSAISSGTRLSF